MSTITIVPAELLAFIGFAFTCCVVPLATVAAGYYGLKGGLKWLSR